MVLTLDLRKTKYHLLGFYLNTLCTIFSIITLKELRRFFLICCSLYACLCIIIIMWWLSTHASVHMLEYKGLGEGVNCSLLHFFNILNYTLNIIFRLHKWVAWTLLPRSALMWPPQPSYQTWSGEEGIQCGEEGGMEEEPVQTL